MKKILFFTLGLFSLTSCYEDYVSDYDWTGVYFAKQHNVRTLVVGEKMSIEVGVQLSGVLKNETDREISYRINNELVGAEDAIIGFQNHQDAYVKDFFTETGVTEITPMPADWYSCANEAVITIPKGEHLGRMKVEFDAEKLLSAPKDTKLPYYVLPLEITDAPNVDKIVEGKSTTLIGIRYENTLFGNYWHGGVSEVKDPEGTIIHVNPYYTTIPQAEQRVYVLKTVGPNSLETNKIGPDEGSIKITLNEDKTVTVSKSSTSSVDVIDEGSKYNDSKLLQDRKIFLKYRYDNGDGTTTHVTDTLTFRNRVRDGVFEWRSENPEDYK